MRRTAGTARHGPRRLVDLKGKLQQLAHPLTAAGHGSEYWTMPASALNEGILHDLLAVFIRVTNSAQRSHRMINLDEGCGPDQPRLTGHR
jgi:hypothetical protein